MRQYKSGKMPVRSLIVLPTYNERENVGRLVGVLLEIAPHADVWLVDDASPDGTADHASELFSNNTRFWVMRRAGPRGYGHSLLDAYRKAVDLDYARLVQLDADFSHDPAVVPALLQASATADVVIGSRYCAGGTITNWSLHRRLLSKAANRYVQLIVGLRVRDSTSGFRCYSRAALQCITVAGPGSEGYAFLVETTALVAAEGLSIVELPVEYTERREGTSKMSWSVIAESIAAPWRIRFSRRDRGTCSLQ
jgi:dolichol-phosphate mannosyltransferase